MEVFNHFKKEVKSIKNEHSMKTDKIHLLKLIHQAVRINVTEHDARITIVLFPVHETLHSQGFKAHTGSESGNT